MKYHSKIVVCAVVLFLFAREVAFSQSEEKVINEPKIYFGLGMGLDYGGIFGLKAEFLPLKHFGIFGGVGYNLTPTVGWNAGVTFKTLPNKRVSPNLMAFYGYNAVLKIDGASEYDATSYGISFGVNVDVKIKRNKFTFGLFVPIRSGSFNEIYNAAKKDPRVIFKNELLPIGFGIGFNFGI